MLKFMVLAMVGVAAVLAGPRPEEARYKSRLDNIDVDEALQNKRLVDNYIKCALGKGPCVPEAKDIKEQIIDLLPEILETNCAKCTEDQKIKVRKMLHYLHDNRKEAYDELLNKYDPDRKLRIKYKEKYTNVAKNEGFSDFFD